MDRSVGKPQRIALYPRASNRESPIVTPKCKGERQNPDSALWTKATWLDLGLWMEEHDQSGAVLRQECQGSKSPISLSYIPFIFCCSCTLVELKWKPENTRDTWCSPNSSAPKQSQRMEITKMATNFLYLYVFQEIESIPPTPLNLTLAVWLNFGQWGISEHDTSIVVKGT